MVARKLIVTATAGLALILPVAAQDLAPERIRKAYHDSYLLEHRQDYKAAMRALAEVRGAFENGYTINYRMGWLSYLNGRYADALNYFKKALAVYPASIEVMRCISLTYVAKQAWNRVEEENYKILKVDYYNETANYWYAYSLRMQKKYDLAEKVCRKLLVVYPSSANMLFELGENRYALTAYDEALEIFRGVIVLDPYNTAAKKRVAALSAKE